MAGREAPATTPALALFPARLALTVTAEDLARQPQYADNHALCRAAVRAGYGWAWHHGAALEVGFSVPYRAPRTCWCAYYLVPPGRLAAGPLTLTRLRVEDWTPFVCREGRRAWEPSPSPQPKIALQSATSHASRTRETTSLLGTGGNVPG